MEPLVPSRVMRLEDYSQLEPQLSYLSDFVGSFFGGWNPVQHRHRHWEYSLSLQVFDRWRQGRLGPFAIADFGAGYDYVSPILYKSGHRMTMFEIWSMGNIQELMLSQMNVIKSSGTIGSYELVEEDLTKLSLKYFGSFDVSLCISTLEHILDYKKAFRELCQSVKPGGLIFVTMDYGDGQTSSNGYFAAHSRPAGIPDEKYMYGLVEVGEKEGCRLFGGDPEWSWDESCRLLNKNFAPPLKGFGFVSLAMVKVGENR